jgi:hypothetical protein
MGYSSWRKRRWKVFKSAYNTDFNFRSEILTIKLRLKNDEVIEDDETEKLGDIFRKYGIPIDIWQACIYFLAKPDELERKYLELVMPPFLFWNAMLDKVGPFAGNVSVSSIIRERLAYAHDNGDISFDIDKINYLELAQALFGYHTVVEIAPNVGKEEVRELAHDFWNELEPLIKNPSLEHSHGTKLLSHVQPPKFEKIVDRDARIMELVEQGNKAKKIVSMLAEDKAKYLVPNEAYLRVIISRNRRKKP